MSPRDTSADDPFVVSVEIPGQPNKAVRLGPLPPIGTQFEVDPQFTENNRGIQLEVVGWEWRLQDTREGLGEWHIVVKTRVVKPPAQSRPKKSAKSKKAAKKRSAKKSK